MITSETTASPAPRVSVPMTSTPEVSIIVVAYGTGSVLHDSIHSIVRCTDRYDYEVIVVSNPHPTIGQRSAHHLRLGTSGVRLICPPFNTGFGGGCELGALHARGDWLAFVNPDVIVGDDWLTPLIDVVRDSAQPTIAAPVLHNSDGSLQEAGQLLDARGHTRPVLQRPAPGEVIDVDYSSAACWVMRRTLHEDLGGFDPAYHPAYFEDVDFALRLTAAGGRLVVVGSSTITHLLGHGAPGDAAPANPQREVLLERWPSIEWRYDRH